jgi:hypothetical protein
MAMMTSPSSSACMSPPATTGDINQMLTYRSPLQVQR